MTTIPTRRPSARLLLAASALAVLAACNLLLGTETAERDDAFTEPDGAPELDATSADAVHTIEDAQTDGSAYPAVACGDGLGLRAGAPWPTGGACNTRVSRAAVPPLKKPKIKWRYAIPASPGAEFMSGPALGPDGGIYAVFAQFVDPAFEYSLVCVRDGGLRFKTPFAAGASVPTAVPTLAADGTVYASTMQGLSAFEATGGHRWTYPVSQAGDSSPLVLADGTIVVAGSVLAAVHPDGAKRWELAPSGARFVGSAAVTASGLLVVGEAPEAGTLNGGVAIVSAEGQRRASVPVAMSPQTTPLSVENGRIVEGSAGGVQTFDEKGTPGLFIATGISSPQSFAAYAPPRVWISANKFKAHLLELNLDGGGLTSHDLDGTVAAAGDGSLVLVKREGGVGVVLGLDPTGAERWRVALESTSADLRPPALFSDGSVAVTLGTVVYVLGD